MCGGTIYEGMVVGYVDGLSPRVRGNRLAEVEHPDPLGSIPACAGEPDVSHISVPREKVYPRVCGGTAVNALRNMKSTGLSPRVRGNRVA